MNTDFNAAFEAAKAQLDSLVGPTIDKKSKMKAKNVFSGIFSSLGRSTVTKAEHTIDKFEPLKKQIMTTKEKIIRARGASYDTPHPSALPHQMLENLEEHIETMEQCISTSKKRVIYLKQLGRESKKELKQEEKQLKEMIKAANEFIKQTTGTDFKTEEINERIISHSRNHIINRLQYLVKHTESHNLPSINKLKNSIIDKLNSNPSAKEMEELEQKLDLAFTLNETINAVLKEKIKSTLVFRPEGSIFLEEEFLEKLKNDEGLKNALKNLSEDIYSLTPDKASKQIETTLNKLLEQDPDFIIELEKQYLQDKIEQDLINIEIRIEDRLTQKLGNLDNDFKDKLIKNLNDDFSKLSIAHPEQSPKLREDEDQRKILLMKVWTEEAIDSKIDSLLTSEIQAKKEALGKQILEELKKYDDLPKDRFIEIKNMAVNRYDSLPLVEQYKLLKEADYKVEVERALKEYLKDDKRLTNMKSNIKEIVNINTDLTRIQKDRMIQQVSEEAEKTLGLKLDKPQIENLDIAGTVKAIKGLDAFNVGEKVGALSIKEKKNPATEKLEGTYHDMLLPNLKFTLEQEQWSWLPQERQEQVEKMLESEYEKLRRDGQQKSLNLDYFNKDLKAFQNRWIDPDKELKTKMPLLIASQIKEAQEHAHTLLDDIKDPAEKIRMEGNIDSSLEGFRIALGKQLDFEKQKKLLLSIKNFDINL